MIKTGDFTFHEDLKDEIDVLFGTEKDMQELSLVRFLPYKVGLATEEKHEWREDTLNPETITLTASGAGADWDTNNDITGLPVPAGTISRLKEGSMLKLGTGEVVRVKSVDTVGNTIDLTKRGHGGTTAAAQGAVAFTAYIIGDAQEDGDDPIDSSYLAPTDAYNFVQIFEEVLSPKNRTRQRKYFFVQFCPNFRRSTFSVGYGSSVQSLTRTGARTPKSDQA